MPGDGQKDPITTAAETLVNEAFSLKEMVTETREDVKHLVRWAERVDVRLESGTKKLDDHEVRLRKQEAVGLRLSGAWSTIGILAAGVAGTAGLTISALGLILQ